MELDSLIGSTIIGVIVILLIGYLYRYNIKQITPNEYGHKELKGNKLFLYLGLVCISFIGIFWMATIYFREEGMIVGGIIITILFGIGTRYFLRIYSTYRVVFDEEIIWIHNKNGNVKHIKWRHISSISYEPFSGNIKLTSDKEEASFIYLLVGLNEFLDEMEKQTKYKAKDLNLPFR